MIEPSRVNRMLTTSVASAARMMSGMTKENSFPGSLRRTLLTRSLAGLRSMGSRSSPRSSRSIG